MKPLITQSEAIAALNDLMDKDTPFEIRKLQYFRLRELIEILIPKEEEEQK